MQKAKSWAPRVAKNNAVPPEKVLLKTLTVKQKTASTKKVAPATARAAEDIKADNEEREKTLKLHFNTLAKALLQYTAEEPQCTTFLGVMESCNFEKYPTALKDLEH